MEDGAIAEGEGSSLLGGRCALECLVHRDFLLARSVLGNGGQSPGLQTCCVGTFDGLLEESSEHSRGAASVVGTAGEGYLVCLGLPEMI